MHDESEENGSGLGIVETSRCRSIENAERGGCWDSRASRYRVSEWAWDL